MSRVTNRVPLDALRDFLAAAQRASLAWIDPEGRVQAVPVAFRWRSGRAQVGLSRDARPPGLGSGSAVAVTADDGFFWWELRALLVRGTLAASPDPADAGTALEWLEVPGTTTAWDYGTLREEGEPGGP